MSRHATHGEGAAQALARLGELAAEWPQLSRLLDEALALAPAARAAWLRELPEEHAPLRAMLARLLETRSQVESGDFLATLPKIDHASPVLAGAADPAVPRACDAVGPYRLVRELGEGGMGSVWLAERADGLLKRPVALKLPRLTWVRGLAERLARERDILAKLEHPNIARLYDAGLDDVGRPWLALEYVRGRPIDAHARDHALSVKQRLALLLQVCEAVAYAHGRRVIHRDIKPANILVTDDGQVRLLDFGIAKLMQQDDGAAAQTALTESTGHALTLAYASPEQVRGEALTAASDLYSLGVVAYELLTGAAPYAVQPGRRAELQSAIERGEVRPASEATTDARARRALRGELGAVLAMALALRPEQRYADVETLARELGRVLQGRPVLAPPRAAPAARAASIRFGAFTLQPGRQRLLADGEPVKLGSRAFDLLGVLVQLRDRVVPKSELQARVWPDQRVDAANLSGQVQALRQVLGREAIVTVPGRGYRFVLPVVGDGPDDGQEPAGPATGGPAQPRGHLPEAVEPLIGRARDRAALGRLVAAHRLVTLLGSGGVGKTRLAQAVAADLLPGFGDGAWWIALAPLADPERVPDAVAHALRLTLGGRADAARAVAGRLRDSRALLVLDNAEHLLGGVRALVGALGELAPSVHVLVTSQAPLQLPGEQRLRLAPLSLPDGSGVAACRGSDAVALFEARARSVDPSFTLDEATWEAAADVCRRLDGIPLAIELAAARLPLLGLEGLRQRLDARFQLLTAGSAAALPRHQTLQAALSWSHGLLPAEAQRVFRRLGVFAGSCTLEAVQQVAVDAELGPWEVVEQLATLVDRSLVLAEGGASPRYRLLETARLFALERLREAGEEDRLRERHARALDEWLTVRRQDARLWRTPPAPPQALVAELDNARAALAWAQDHADDGLVLRLAAGASHVFLTAALNAEYLERVLPLRGRVRADTPAELAGRFWSRIAFAAGRNGHAAGLEAGHRAIAAWRALGDEGLLYDALTWTIAIGARQGRVEEAQALIEEGERIERDAWPPALRSSFRWAKHRWLQLQGRADEALACARQQAELLAQAGVWVMHVAWGANVADCEISLGRPAEAEAHARAALEALDGLGVDENIVGHVMDALVVALVQLGRGDEAMPVARRARRLLAREGDDLRLLEPLAAAAGARGQWDVAARLAGHVDAAIAQSGETRWPSAVQRRAQLQEGLDRALPAAAQRELMRAGASMTRDEAFALALDDPPMPGKPAPR